MNRKRRNESNYKNRMKWKRNDETVNRFWMRKFSTANATEWNRLSAQHPHFYGGKFEWISEFSIPIMCNCVHRALGTGRCLSVCVCVKINVNLILISNLVRSKVCKVFAQEIEYASMSRIIAHAYCIDIYTVCAAHHAVVLVSFPTNTVMP